MTVTNPPAWLQEGEYPAHTDRLVSSSLVAEPGVVKTGDLAVRQSDTPGMSVVVPSGHAWIRDGVGSTASQGMYNFVNIGDETLAVDASHASQYRVDRVVARIEDSELSGTVDLASLAVLKGDNAASLVAAQALTPAVPARSESLATVTVNPSASSITTADITPETTVAKLYSEMAPGVTVVTSSSRPIGTDRIVGMLIYETDTKRTWQWNGSEWQFRGGPGPRGFVNRPGDWGMVTGETRYIVSLAPLTGSSFETAYYTFVDSVSNSVGDRIRVKQSGMYAIEMYSVLTNNSSNFNLSFRAYTAVNSSSLPSGAEHFPTLSGRYLQGLNRIHDSRTIFLPVNTEIAVEFLTNVSGTTVNEFWLGMTLVG
jgi:hypothetical protein